MSARVVATDAAGLADAAGVVRAGGVLVYPTETVYGLGGDARRPDVLARVRALKGRDADAPVLVLTDTWGRVAGWIEAPEPTTARLMAHEPPLAVTLLLPASGGAPVGLVGPEGRIGVRRTSDPFCRALIASAGTPLISTSANPTGAPAPAAFAAVDAGLLDGADLAVDAGHTLAGVPSTVAAVEGGRLVVVRQGSVPGVVLERIAAGGG